MKKYKTLLLLHLLLMIYSMSGIFSKLASSQPFLSARFCLYYGAILVLLALYAVGWQQVIKRMPLTLAFANKAVTTIWGLVWGMMFFGERVTFGKLIGVVLVIIGIVVFSTADRGNA